MELKLLARLRPVLQAVDAGSVGNDEQPTLNQQFELLVAEGSMPYENTVVAGRAFYTGTTAAIAAVVAVPTTATMLALYNNDIDGGRSLVIDWVAAQNVVSTAVAAQAQILGLVGQVRETAPTDAALAIKKRNGLGSGTNDTKVRTILNATALPATTGIAGGWFPIGGNGVKAGSAATPGYGCYQRVDGDLIVPPGRYLALHVLANVVSETFVIFCGWHEKQVTLG